MRAKIAILLALIILFLTPFFSYLLASSNPVETMIRSSHRGGALSHRLYQDIYQEKTDIDILLVESSQVQFSLDDKLLNHLFLKYFNRKLNIVRLRIYQQGMEIQSLLTQEILKRRKIKLIALELQNFNQKILHPTTCLHANLPTWKDHLENLDTRFKTTLFACSILSSWRNMYTQLDPNIFPQKKVGNSFQPNQKARRQNSPVLPSPDDLEKIMNYARSIEIGRFLFDSGNATKVKILTTQPGIEGHFVSKIVKLARENHISLIGIRPPIPTFFNGRVTLNEETQKVLVENRIPLIGLTPQLLLGTTYALTLNDIFISPQDGHTNEKGMQLSTVFYFRALAALLMGKV